ncbi:MAG TPA: FkbM family methyltransferase [Candidatus Bathyarchaeia archaeon]|nr:FkbM family methyltransferase [Candidatus Bathyarchaeia archaeon]
MGLVSPQDKVFLDVGAHYGLVSARIASMLPRSLRVIAIEAHPANYGALKNNIELNRLTNAEAHNFAIANSTGTTHMQAHDGISTHYKLTNNDLSANSSPDVRCYTLPDVLEKLELSHVDLVKLDIEGLELEVLQSCFPALTGRIGKLDIEVHHVAEVAPIRDLLVASGFAVQVRRWGILSESHRVIAVKTSLNLELKDIPIQLRA